MSTNRIIIVGVSGGKDSTLTLLRALDENADEIIPVMNETGFEHPVVLEYLEYLENKLGVKIQRIRNKHNETLIDLIKRYKKFPSTHLRFCTGDLKRTPLYNYLLQFTDREGQIEYWTGVRRYESNFRAKKYANISDKELYKFNEFFSIENKKLAKIYVRLPILNLATQQVFDELKRRGIDPCPIYSMGYSRVSCFPCFLWTINQFRKYMADEVVRKRIELIIQLEEEFKREGIKATVRQEGYLRDLIYNNTDNGSQLSLNLNNCEVMLNDKS